MQLASINPRRLAQICRAHGVIRLEVFGSAATGDFVPEQSDVDLLVEFAPSQALGPWLSGYFALKKELENLLGHPVDLVMTGALKRPRFKASVNQQRRVLYAA